MALGEGRDQRVFELTSELRRGIHRGHPFKVVLKAFGVLEPGGAALDQIKGFRTHFAPVRQDNRNDSGSTRGPPSGVLEIHKRCQEVVLRHSSG